MPTQGSHAHLEVLLVVVVDGSQYDAHEDVQTDDEVANEKQGKPVAAVIRWHPGNENNFILTPTYDCGNIQVLSLRSSTHSKTCINC